MSDEWYFLYHALNQYFGIFKIPKKEKKIIGLLFFGGPP